jgi:putative transposase
MQSGHVRTRRTAGKEGAARVPHPEPTPVLDAVPPPGGAHPDDISFAPGARLTLGAIPVQLVNALSLERLLVRDLQTGETRIVARAAVGAIESSSAEPEPPRAARTNVNDEQVARLTAREEMLKPYLGGRALTRKEARRLGNALGVSARTVCRWLQRYRHAGDITGLMPRPRGVQSGQRTLDPAVDAIIRFAVEGKLRSTGNCSVRSVYEAIRGDCEAIGKRLPARATVLSRVKALKADPQCLPPEVAQEVRSRRRLVRGSAEAPHALSRVEIDHTLVDTHIVDARDREPLGRPWLTIAMDVCTRVIMGFVLTLEAPSRLSVALCLRHAIYPKEQWLERVGAKGPWPVYGRPRLIYTDNGGEFRSPSFRMGCKRQHIENGYRPVRTPRFGGSIERLIGTFMRRMRLIPGNTFNEILGKRSPFPAQEAVLTLEDLERWFAHEITAYHHERHRTLGMTPLAAWEAAWRTPHGMVVPPHPADPHTLFTDLLPHALRAIKPVGIDWHCLRYRSDAVAPYVDPDTKRVIRFDPRDISSVWLELPGGGHLQVPWVNAAWPRLSLWEWNEIRTRDRRRAKGADPELVRQCLAENDALIAERAARGELRARRRLARAERWRSAETPQDAAPSAPSAPPSTRRLSRRRGRKARRPAPPLPPLPRTQLEVTCTSVESAVSFEVLE